MWCWTSNAVSQAMQTYWGNSPSASEASDFSSVLLSTPIATTAVLSQCIAKKADDCLRHFSPLLSVDFPLRVSACADHGYRFLILMAITSERYSVSLGGQLVHGVLAVSINSLILCSSPRSFRFFGRGAPPRVPRLSQTKSKYIIKTNNISCFIMASYWSLNEPFD